MHEMVSLTGFAGGLLIGLAGAIYLLFNGRIAGMTGVMAQALFAPRSAGGATALTFLLSAFVVPLAISGVVVWEAVQVTHSVVALVVGGVLVGIGVTLANGCTSGHGVCGMSRLSRRSIVVTLGFMAATALTVTVIRHRFGG